MTEPERIQKVLDAMESDGKFPEGSHTRLLVEERLLVEKVLAHYGSRHRQET